MSEQKIIIFVFSYFFLVMKKFTLQKSGGPRPPRRRDPCMISYKVFLIQGDSIKILPTTIENKRMSSIFSESPCSTIFHLIHTFLYYGENKINLFTLNLLVTKVSNLISKKMQKKSEKLFRLLIVLLCCTFFNF